MRHQLTHLQWKPLPFESAQTVKAIDRVLESWTGTPYMDGQCVKGEFGGVNCVGYVVSVMNELRGRPLAVPPQIARDACLHNKDACAEVMKLLLQLYAPFTHVSGLEVEPGDVVVVGPVNGGPGHVLFGGTSPSVLHHCIAPKVTRTGCELPFVKVFAIYRATDKINWR